MSDLADQFPTCCVDVVETGGRAKNGFVRCEIDKHLIFDARGLESYLFAKWEPLVYDALLLAAAAEFCDRLRQRSSLVWAREIHLRLPVFGVEQWKTARIQAALIDALNFVTGDRWSIDFRARRSKAPQLQHSELDLSGHVRAVIPFSKGLDSWAVAALEDNRCRGLLRVRLVRAAPSTPASGHRLPFTHIPYRVQFHGYRDRESSCRSRGFKFALISGIAAYLAKVAEVIVPESGQGSVGPALVVTGHAAPDLRTHPRFTAKMEHLIFELFGHRVRYCFPRLWYSKGETLRAAATVVTGSTGWSATWSCWQSQRHASVRGVQRQCGICAACQLRRLSIHSAGLSEPKDTCVWEDLQAQQFGAGASPGFARVRERGALKKHGIAGTAFLAELAALSASPARTEMLRRNASLIGPIIGISQLDAERNQRELLSRHRTEWDDFVRWAGPQSFLAHWARAAQ